jgi:5'-nucleotidase
VWKVAISLNDQKSEISAERIPINESTFGVDENYQRQIVAAYHDQLKQKMGYLDRTIGNVSQVNSDRCFEATEEVVRNEQSDWGAFLAERMRNAYANQKAQIGILNGGTIRIDDNFCDLIRYEQMERSIGFSTNVVYVKLSGADLKREILEHAVGTKRGDGRFLQVAGLRFDFNRSLRPGDRVFNVRVQQGSGWTDLDPKGTYSVAVSEYLFNCGDDYDFRRSVTEYIPPGPDLRALVIDSFDTIRMPNIANSTLEGVVETPSYLSGKRVQNAHFLPIGNNNQCTRN